MLKEERFANILKIVNESGYVSLHDLMNLTNSSESTIRADLVELGKEGKIIRLRGGAQAINKNVVSYELSNKAKKDIEPDAKKVIGEYAAKLVKDNSVIYIDAGTTTIHMVNFINAKNVTIITNSLSIGVKAKLRGFKVNVTGGDIKLNTDAFIGALAQDIISHFTFDMGFFGVNGIDTKEGITTPELEEALVKKMAMSRSKQIYVLADHTKFGVKTAVNFHPFVGEEIITDKITNADYLNKGIMEVK